jgi:CubicO group peptidase (beta-lactamase class C family)
MGVEGALIFAFCLFTFAFASAQGLPMAKPETVGMNAAKLNQIEALVEQDIKDKKLPGAVIIVGHKGKIVYRKAFGNRSLVPTVEPMTVDTIFDVASITKPIATATSIMILVEQGKLRLGDTVGKFIPEIDDPEAKRVTIQQLLTHTSGYAPDFDLKEKWTGRDGMLAALKKEKLRNPPGTRFVYSDIGFIVLGEIVQRLSADSDLPPIGFGLWRFAASKVFRPTGMEVSNFARTSEKYGRDSVFVAPSENIRGQNNYLGSKFEGDSVAAMRYWDKCMTRLRIEWAVGHAGLFSTADDPNVTHRCF